MRRVRKTKTYNGFHHQRTLIYTLVEESLKQFSDISEEISTCEEDSETDSTAAVSESSEPIVSEVSSIILVGDVVWSKVSGHNWWPSMVSYDPNAAVYFQKSVKHPNINVKYHVQFFGEKPLRGWVATSNILKFQGREHFISLTCNSLPASNQTEVWDYAVSEAEKAILLDRKERKLAYVFNYQARNPKLSKRKYNRKGELTKVKVSTTDSERRKSLRLNTPIKKRKGNQLRGINKYNEGYFERPNTRRRTNTISADNYNLTSADDSNLASGDNSNLASADNSNIASADNSNIASADNSNIASADNSNIASADNSNIASADNSNLASADNSNHSPADNCNLQNSQPSIVSPVKLSLFVSQEIELNKTNQNSILTSDNISSNDESVSKNNLVLQDISWAENELLNKAIYPDVGNSSDSGIEDIEIETLESSSDDMESLGLKRKRKQKIFEGFHTGDEIIDAFKSKQKLKADTAVVEKAHDSDMDIDKKSEKENVIHTDDSDLLPAKSKAKSKKKSQKKCSESIQKVNDKVDDSAVAKQDIVSSTLIEPCTVNMKSVSSVKGTKRNIASENKDTETTINVYNEDLLVAKKAKVDLAVTKSKKTDTFTKIKPKFKNNDEIEHEILSFDESDVHTEIEEDAIDQNTTIINPKDDQNNSSLSKFKRDPKDQFCTMCEEVNDDLISCSGSCLNQFHHICLGLNFKPTNDFVCDECTTGYHTCFTCRQAGDLKKCSQYSCGKYYHIQCLESNDNTRFENKSKDKFTCPLHACKFCNNEKEKTGKTVNGKKFLRCIRCPTAYHHNCIAAGCSILTPSFMICDDHYESSKSNSKITHVNVTWCFICSLGGSLVCCDTCPASFHAECAGDMMGVPEGAWQCSDCREGCKLRYGDIVWVKYSIYRWWPGMICYPEEVPEKIQLLPHTIGEFPVLFFGSRDYCWLNSGRVFKYAEGDTGGQSHSGTQYLAKYFSKALEEAMEAYGIIEKKRVEELEAYDKKNSNKPPLYRRIKYNRPVSCVQTILDRSEWPICQCKDDDPCKSDCLNQMLYYECSPLNCPVGEKCCNQRMQKCEYAKAVPFKCEGKGWGLESNQEIKTGDFVVEYVGELIDEQTCRARIKQYHEKDIYDYYFLTIDKDNIIDAYPKGNLSRFMNHSCDPNCETQKWTVSGEVRVGLFATRDIAVGEELSFNYNLDCLGNEKKQCKCGSANCSGFLGVQPKTQHSMAVAEKAKKSKDKQKRKLKRKRKHRVVYDDECFSCGDGGELICCGRHNCTKTYHQDCLIMKERPKGKWECPWHFCDVCGKVARSMCTLCPNSFCERHLDGQMVELQEDVIVCPTHGKKEIERLKTKMSNQEKKSHENVNTKSSKSKKAKTAKSSDSKLQNKTARSIPIKDNTSKNSRKKVSEKKEAIGPPTKRMLPKSSQVNSKLKKSKKEGKSAGGRKSKKNEATAKTEKKAKKSTTKNVIGGKRNAASVDQKGEAYASPSKRIADGVATKNNQESGIATPRKTDASGKNTRQIQTPTSSTSKITPTGTCDLAVVVHEVSKKPVSKPSKTDLVTVTLSGSKKTDVKMTVKATNKYNKSNKWTKKKVHSRHRNTGK